MKSIFSRLMGKKSSDTEMTIKYRYNARVFISRHDETAIIVTLHYNGQRGFLFEDENPVVLGGLSKLNLWDMKPKPPCAEQRFVHLSVLPSTNPGTGLRSKPAG